MTRSSLAIALLILAIALPADGGDCDKEKCRKVKEDIRNIESRMRAGYSAAQGIRLEERLRKLKKKRRETCC